MAQDRSGARTGSRKSNRGDSEGLWDWNLESDRIHFSPRWTALVGCEDHEIGNTSEDWFQRVHPDDSTQLLREIDLVRTGDGTTFACRYRLRHKDGAYRWMSCRGTVARDKTGRAIRLSGSQSDITVQMVTDPLTGLPNRLLLVDRLTHSIERARRYGAFHFAVLLIDLGRPANLGRLSHKAISDSLVTAVARRLETCLRIPESMPSLRHNDLVARMEGDYFAILLDGLKEVSHAKIVADRVLGQILNPFALGGREIRLSASIGIAVSPTGYTKADDVLHDAETALHRARVLGGSHCEVFDTAILKSEQAELQLEGDFEAALQRREFELFYQPIVSLVSNDVLGFEALVRWRHPVLGMIGPADFIPIAERTGFIVPLGNWIMREACLRLAAWQTDLGVSKDLSVSVNISSVQWSNAALDDQVRDALHESGLDPRCLVLELTEGIAMANPTAVTTSLMRLRAIGVRISIDDFGTGYSSLSYLRQFPIDTVKIDRSFVRGMVTDKDDAEIVGGVIHMSRKLGFRVVAEGIEHEDQYARLRALKCDAGQGDLFAKALDVDEAAELLNTGLAPRPAVLGREARIPQHWVRGTRFVARNRVASIVALLALLSSAGLAVVMLNTRAAAESRSVPATDVGPSPAAPRSAPTDVPTIATEPVVEHPSPRPSPPATAPIPSIKTTSLDVVHLHRIGSCRGRLDVTRDGVTFVPGENSGDEFTLKYAEFLHALVDDTLTLKSANKTYRFKAAASGGENPAGLRELTAQIARARR